MKDTPGVPPLVMDKDRKVAQIQDRHGLAYCPYINGPVLCQAHNYSKS